MVLESLRQQDILSRNPEDELQSSLTVGQRLADRVANVGGSWTFITWFTVVFVVWILSNSVFLATRPFDPYPFIFLNLVLSCLAAIQAPVIMMSQNRQEARDRLHAMRDYQVNLKAELEIRHLHQKVDHLLSHQWERLVEIQEIQMELISEVRGCSRSLIVLIDYTPWGNLIFTTAPIFAEVWLFVIPFGVVLLTTEELRKWLVRRMLPDALP